ncbi:dienelactone hydrolase family protein [Pelagicoccus enzymogenes]|uniref:dienelactone hydrolase family protein n=1 Tax=Pelagicoccus enzymogenes TaxID=2773457 RepID=UPI00280F4CEE|nr:dienelactone hydrolase family protein [Pelagicoccus enzymogenes]MDQ8199323.1 dienelactone hydrolase family protein [Pelagicoccus enzymogenes]
MKKILLLPILLSISASLFAKADFQSKTVRYQLDGTTFESTIVYSKDGDSSKPGILMVPNWMGPTEGSLQKAAKVASDKYIVMMVDMYGVQTRPSNGQEAGAAAGAVRADRDLMRARSAKALSVFKSEAKELGLNANKVAAIGFCFGGGTVLELGRSGAELDAIVSFHGDLLSPTLAEDAASTQAKVLVLHGADDPYVPQSDVETFVKTMQGTNVDWQLVQYSDTVHSFTNPEANSDGARYNAISSQRAFAAMEALLAEAWR